MLNYMIFGFRRSKSNTSVIIIDFEVHYNIFSNYYKTVSKLIFQI